MGGELWRQDEGVRRAAGRGRSRQVGGRTGGGEREIEKCKNAEESRSKVWGRRESERLAGAGDRTATGSRSENRSKLKRRANARMPRESQLDPIASAYDLELLCLSRSTSADMTARCEASRLLVREAPRPTCPELGRVLLRPSLQFLGDDALILKASFSPTPSSDFDAQACLGTGRVPVLPACATSSKISSQM